MDWLDWKVPWMKGRTNQYQNKEVEGSEKWRWFPTVWYTPLHHGSTDKCVTSDTPAVFICFIVYRKCRLSGRGHKIQGNCYPDYSTSGGIHSFTVVIFELSVCFLRDEVSCWILPKVQTMRSCHKIPWCCYQKYSRWRHSYRVHSFPNKMKASASKYL